MLARRFNKSRILSSGLLMAACTFAAGNAFAQEGQVTTASVRKPALIEAYYLELPATKLEDETSPSDSPQSLKAVDANLSKVETTTSQDDAKTSKDEKSESSKDKNQDALAPMQNRALNIRVQATSINSQKIGTGLIPTPSSSRTTPQIPLPTGASRGMVHTHVYWEASNIQHNPLYFEDAMLERHGHKRSFCGYDVAQSMISGVKFFATIPLLPYHETLRPKHSCVYALGNYRAGSGAPCLRDNIPYDSKAAIVESASAAAFFWAIPL